MAWHDCRSLPRFGYAADRLALEIRRPGSLSARSASRAGAKGGVARASEGFPWT